MHFEASNIYHVYNRGNEKQTIFFNRENYIFFLRKIRNEWLPYCNILAYCLMPNHFHFLIMPNALACKPVYLKEKETHMQYLSKAIGKTLSSYTQAINIEQERTGNLFQKKTKSKLISTNENDVSLEYLLAGVYYIHANPLAADLVQTLDEWEFSSYKDYCGSRNGTLCNKGLLYQLSGMNDIDFRRTPALPEKIIEAIF